MLQVSVTNKERKEEHIQMTMCHHALGNFLPLSFVIGRSFLDTIMCRMHLPRSAPRNPSTFLIFSVDVSSNQTISGM
jgi:hypothetical protein